MARNYRKIKEIQDALAANDITTATSLIAALKKELVGADNTLYTYKCNKCGLKCMIVCGIDNFDLNFCFDDMKSGNGNFKQTDVSIGA